MTFYVLLIATTLAGSRVSSQVTVINDKAVQQALEFNPGSRPFLITFVLSFVSLIAWYAVPGLDTDLFRAIALTISGVELILFMVYYVQVFQRHLDVE